MKQTFKKIGGIIMSTISLKSNCDGNQVDLKKKKKKKKKEFQPITSTPDSRLVAPDSRLVARETCLISTTQIKFNQVDS